MIKGKRREQLTPETILSKISEYDIFKWYMPNPWKMNNVTYSPFRSENNPSFIIGNKYGNLSFIDFADTSKRGNCFVFVKLLFNLSSIDDVLRLIDRDFGLGISTKNIEDVKRVVPEYKQPESLGKRYSLIQVVTRKFTNEELEYWNQLMKNLNIGTSITSLSMILRNVAYIL